MDDVIDSIDAVETPAALPKPGTPSKDTTETLYEAWRLEPTADNLNRVVRSLDNTIGYKVASMGVGNNPQMKHQARLYAADAVRKFDPASGTNLRTWTQSQLQSLQRFKRENQGPVKIPDRAAVDAWTIEKATRELEDETGMEPDVKRLADRTGLSVKRIANVRKITRPVAAADQMFDEGKNAPDFLGEAMEYVYDGADPVDRKIIELTTGYGGSPVLSKKMIAQRLGISPSQVTRRADRIGMQVQEMDADISDTYT